MAHHEATFVDSLSLVNLLAGVPLSSLEMVSFFRGLTHKPYISRSFDTMQGKHSTLSIQILPHKICSRRLFYAITATLSYASTRSSGMPYAFDSNPFQHSLPRQKFSVDISCARLRNPSVSTALDHGASANFLLSSLSRLLRKGLGNRTKAIAVLHPASGRRPLSQAHPISPTFVHVGLIHDHQHALRSVDHGPTADD